MGFEYAARLASMGYRLLIVSNNEDRLGEAADKLRDRYGADVTALFMDLASGDAAESLYSFCKEKGFEVEILINNAGMFFFRELTPGNHARADAMMTLHLLTPYRLCLLFGEDMKRRGHGYILNMSSVGASLPMPGMTVYAATKAFLKSFGKSLYFEMRPYGVGVTTVCPGAVATPLYRLKPSLMRLGVGIGIIKRPEVIVRRALRGMFRKRRTVNPSLMSYYLPPLIALLPKFMVDKIWRSLRSRMS